MLSLEIQLVRKLHVGEAEEKYGGDSSEEELDESVESVLKFYRERNASQRFIDGIAERLKNPHGDSDSDSEPEVDPALWDEYLKQIDETEGFGLEIDPGRCAGATLRTLLCFKESEHYYKRSIELSNAAIEEYNKNNTEKDFKVVDIERLVLQRDRGFLYLLTFKAEDSHEGEKTFEAKVLPGIGDGKHIVDLCRMKK